jgi:serine/threonine protein phosphatase PrpC
MLGHEVSGYLRENLPVTMNNELKRKNKNVNIHNVNDVLTNVFVDMNNKLLSGEIVDTTFSGSTCVSMIYTPEKVITANVGDSRAVLGRFKDNGIK